jgi:hypothetical protein
VARALGGRPGLWHWGAEVRASSSGGEQRRGGSCLCRAGRNSSRRCQGRVMASC